jgi:hypothetical protein
VSKRWGRKVLERPANHILGTPDSPSAVLDMWDIVGYPECGWWVDSYELVGKGGNLRPCNSCYMPGESDDN